MFYWDKSSSGVDLERQLFSIHNIKELFIASAYLSKDGLNMLQRLVNSNSVKRENITVCLSAEFSDEHPADILIELNKIANVRIAKYDRLFHPKFYYIKGESDSLLIFGSSNLTSGGFYKNIEFDMICQPSSTELERIRKFMQFCISQTNELADEYIDYYKSKEAKLTN